MTWGFSAPIFLTDSGRMREAGRRERFLSKKWGQKDAWVRRRGVAAGTTLGVQQTVHREHRPTTGRAFTRDGQPRLTPANPPERLGRFFIAAPRHWTQRSRTTAPTPHPVRLREPGT